MRERPILFSGPMVRAILDGRKTQTRRIVKPLKTAPLPTDGDGWRFEPPMALVRDGWNGVSFCPLPACPFGVPGSRLWVREKWADADCMYQGHTNDTPSVIAYEADRSAIQWSAEPPRKIGRIDLASWNWDSLTWRPGMFLWRWASRITLEVTGVRVERLQEITEEDAIAEGIEGPFDVGYRAFRAPGDSKPRWSCARAAFESLWDGINGARAPWASSPWVWVISFRRVA